MEHRDFLKGIFFGILMAGIAVLAFFLLRFGTLGRKGSGADVLTSEATVRKLRQVQYLIEEMALTQPEGDMLETGMFKGIAAGLEDAYASYYDPQEYEHIQRQNEGSYFGIGVVFVSEEETPVVQEVYENSPASRAGILPQDRLLEVNGQPVEGLSFSEAMDLIQGSEEISFVFLRGDTQVEVSCRMGDVMTSEVTWEVRPDGLGYLKIPEFDRVTVQQFADALEELQKAGVPGVVIDLRDNPGGLLESVTAMLDDLLDECLVLTTKSRMEQEEKIYASDGVRYDGKIAVLTNARSASAAEVFSGTLQYYHRAYVAGETTFGKGVVQSTWTLQDGSALKLTTEKYFIAGEVDIDGVGVIPDLETGEDPLEPACSYLLGMTREAAA